jgi:hypothetical protein
MTVAADCLLWTPTISHIISTWRGLLTILIDSPYCASLSAIGRPNFSPLAIAYSYALGISL